MRMILSISFLVAAFFVFSPKADAQSRAQAPAVTRISEGTAGVVRGRRQAPGAFYVLNRAALGYEALDLRRSFTREVVRGAQRSPF